MSTNMQALGAHDEWIKALEEPDTFMSAWFDLWNKRDHQASFKSSNGKQALPPNCTSGKWSDCQAQFYQQGQSVVVRREAMDLPETALERAIKASFNSPAITSHAYLSAGSAQALKPHTDP